MKQPVFRERKPVFTPGSPLVCVPLVGSGRAALLQQAERLPPLPFDLLEWRADCFDNYREEAALTEVLSGLRPLLPDRPILFTLRSQAEGGRADLPWQAYARLNLAAARSGLADLVDVELFSAPEQQVSELTAQLHEAGVRVVLSSHDFDKTPPQDELVRRLALAHSLGADLPKLAVMPQREEDVLTLLAATLEANRRGLGPLITMSMGALGQLSRLYGGLFGSAVTFASAGEASAPGQLPVQQLAELLQLLKT